MEPSDVFGRFTCFCSVGLQPELGSLHVLVLHLGSLSLLHQTGQNKMSTECCYKEIAVGCCHSNSLQSQQSFCSFLGLRAVWVVSLCSFGLIEQGWHDVCQSTFLFSQKWVKAIAGCFAVGLDSSSRAELAELLRVRDGSQLKCWCQQREGFFISLVSPQAELYSSCSAEQL